MIIDHTAYIFSDPIDQFVYSLNSQPPIIFTSTGLRMIGRVSFIIFAYLTAQSCAYTKNIKHYSVRLFLFAILSEIPFDIAFSNVGMPVIGEYPTFLDYGHQNVFFTLAFGVLSVLLYKQLENSKLVKDKGGLPFLKKLILFIPVLLISALANYLNTDYGAVGVISIFMIYLLRDNYTRYIVLLAIVLFLYSSNHIGFVIGGIVGILLIMMHNYKKGPSFKYAFYWIYPLHLSILSLIWLIFFRNNFYGFF